MKRKSFVQKVKDIKRDQYVVDAKGVVLGRLATRVATVLRGKHKATFTPNMDCGDFVTVINALHVKVTGSKEKTKMYFTHSGYPGGDKLLSFEEVQRRDPRRVIKLAVWGMLPKGPLGKQIIKKLAIFNDEKKVEGKPLKV